MIEVATASPLSALLSLPGDVVSTLLAWHQKRVDKQRSVALAYATYLDALSRHIGDPTRWPRP